MKARRKPSILPLAVTLAVAGGLLAPFAAPASAVPTATVRDQAAPPGGEQRIAVDLAADPGALVDVPSTYRPKMRWWWPKGDLDHDEIRRELDTIRKAGFGGVEQVLLTNALDWESPAFRRATAAAVQHANKIGLQFDVTAGPAWPVSGPSVDDPAKNLSMQDLHYGALDLVGPSTYTGPVPDRSPNPAEQTQRTLVAVTAAKVVSRTADEVILDPDTAIDLTSTATGDTISWSVPAGTWKLFGLWMRPSGQRAAFETGRLVADHFNKQAVDAVLADLDELVLDSVDADLKKNGGYFFEDSYEIEHGETAANQTAEFWTPDLLQEFKQRRGYSLAPFLPAIFEEFDMTAGVGERITNDFELTLTDLLVDEHLKPMAAWAKSHGMEMRNQAYMAGVGELGTRDNTRLARHAQNPDVESLGFGDPELLSRAPLVGEGPIPPGSPESREVIERYRYITSGAHLSGADQVSNELGATALAAFAQRPVDYKQLADHSLAAGVTTQIVHGFAYAPYKPGGVGAQSLVPSWPGWCAWCNAGTLPLQIADSWNQNWPQMKAWPSLTGYFARTSALMRNGTPTVDFTVLRPSTAVTGIDVEVTPLPPDPLRQVLHQKGFAWDYIDPVSIRETGQVEDGKLLPDGPAYRAVVVDHGAAMPGATAQRLLSLARQGLPVVVFGEAPERGTSQRDAGQEDALVNASFAQLKTLRNVRTATTPAELAAALEGLGVEASVQPSSPAEIVPVRRRTPGGDVWFLYNNSSQTTSVDLSFASTGQPFEIDLWSGKAERLAEYSVVRGRTVLEMSLPAGGTTALSFQRNARAALHLTETEADGAVARGAEILIRDTKGGTVQSRLSNGKNLVTQIPSLPAPIALDRPYDVTARLVDPAGDRTVDMTMPSPVDWREVPELARQSGEGDYRTTVDLPASWLADGRRVGLDFGGEVGGTVRMWVNSKDAQVRSVPEGRTDITDLLRPGKNQFRFEVATTLINRMNGLSTSGNPEYAAYAARETQPYGLLRAPSLVPSAEVAIARAGSSGSDRPASAEPLGPSARQLPATGGAPALLALAFVACAAGLRLLRRRVS